MKYPSFKIVILIIVGLIIVMGILWYLGKSETPENIVTQNDTVAITSSTTSAHLLKIVEEKITDEGSLAAFDVATLPANQTEADLSIIKNPTPEDKTVYAHAFMEALKPFATMREHESNLVLAIVDQGSTSSVTALQSSQQMHVDFSKQLRDVKVPADAVLFHLNVINITNRLASLLATMTETPREPLKGLNAAYGYTLELPTFFKTLIAINAYFVEQGIEVPEDKRVELYVNLD